MKLFLSFLLALGCGLTACKRDAENSATPAGLPDAANPQAPLTAPPAANSRPAPGTPVVAPESIPVDVALQQLNTAARNFYAEKFQMPVTIDELYQAGFLKQRFAAPAGKEFVINPKTRLVEVR